jgi:hypothetical protein
MKITNLRLWQAIEPEQVTPQKIGTIGNDSIWFVAKGNEGTALFVTDPFEPNSSTELPAYEITELYNGQQSPKLTINPYSL